MIKFLSRKFIGAAVVFITGTGLCIAGKIGGGEWVTISTLALGIYTGGNVAEKKSG